MLECLPQPRRETTAPIVPDHIGNQEDQAESHQETRQGIRGSSLIAHGTVSKGGSQLSGRI